MKKVILTLATMVLLISCTENQRARKFGGSEEIKLNKNEKLISLTWKETNLWVLTEDTVTKEKFFRENSNWGILQGKITIK